MTTLAGGGTDVSRRRRLDVRLKPDATGILFCDLLVRLKSACDFVVRLKADATNGCSIENGADNQPTEPPHIIDCS